MEGFIDTFHFSHWPQIHSGPGVITKLKAHLPDLESVLWVTGGKEGHNSAYMNTFFELSKIVIKPSHRVHISQEPSPQDIDQICHRFQDKEYKTKITKVVAIGGGSVIDAAKALSAMLVTQHSLLDYLEGVGKGLPLPDNILPFIAIPTTSGTGSEMTSNAVFSEIGIHGYKKSIRHDKLIPTEIWLDANLTTSCPPLQTACCGLDAFTQLLEAYLSSKSNVLTTTLAEKGLALIIENLEAACSDGAKDLKVRGELAIASMLSGTCLANAGLGIVHGIAGPMGGYFNIPHGVACANLIAQANQTTLNALIRDKQHQSLDKMAKIGRLCTHDQNLSSAQYCQALVDTLFQWQEKFKIPRLSEYGLNEHNIAPLIQSSSNRNNPVLLTDKEIAEIVIAGL